MFYQRQRRSLTKRMSLTKHKDAFDNAHGRLNTKTRLTTLTVNSPKPQQRLSKKMICFDALWSISTAVCLFCQRRNISSAGQRACN